MEKHVFYAKCELGTPDCIVVCDQFSEFINAVSDELEGFEEAEIEHIANQLREHGIYKFEGDPPLYYHREFWPFVEESNHPILEDRFYGFGDSGGIHGSNDGYATRKECHDELLTDIYGLEQCDVSGSAKDLGEVTACILSGREYLNRLYYLMHDGGGTGELEDYGHWSDLQMPEDHSMEPFQSLAVDAQDEEERALEDEILIAEQTIQCKLIS